MKEKKKLKSTCMPTEARGSMCPTPRSSQPRLIKVEKNPDTKVEKVEENPDPKVEKVEKNPGTKLEKVEKNPGSILFRGAAPTILTSCVFLNG